MITPASAVAYRTDRFAAACQPTERLSSAKALPVLTRRVL
ncbi:hypothetical protein D3OALGA1CA_2023 [Olavius algarvensis associated proteobacterium Delta 3]|nr:hypothetical protein D3OALGA1CA_2023 [Olavius algarvensis associated proteobacterium Delta 3]CAB5119923.1 hypothetical protein D3OALGB2SA_2917 [Olavius algarvensis associated proteobacterium Delta 3]